MFFEQYSHEPNIAVLRFWAHAEIKPDPREAVAKFNGGIAVEHEDPFWDAPDRGNLPDFPQQRKDGFILARRFLGQYLPGRLV